MKHGRDSQRRTDGSIRKVVLPSELGKYGPRQRIAPPPRATRRLAWYAQSRRLLHSCKRLGDITDTGCAARPVRCTSIASPAQHLDAAARAPVLQPDRAPFFAAGWGSRSGADRTATAGNDTAATAGEHAAAAAARQQRAAAADDATTAVAGKRTTAAAVAVAADDTAANVTGKRTAVAADDTAAGVTTEHAATAASTGGDATAAAGTGAHAAASEQTTQPRGNTTDAKRDTASNAAASNAAASNAAASDQRTQPRGNTTDAKRDTASAGGDPTRGPTTPARCTGTNEHRHANRSSKRLHSRVRTVSQHARGCDLGSATGAGSRGRALARPAARV